jgi:arylsulfatase A-like enzyme
MYLFDIFPTVCELTGTAIPPQVEGKSQMPVITRKAPSVREYMFNQYKNVQRSIRTDRWKLIRYPQINVTQLFDLQHDPNEMENLAEEPGYAGRMEELMARLKEAQKSFDDTCPLSSDTPADREWSPEKGKGKGAENR